MVSQHEAVIEAAAIGIPDSKWGERPLIVAVIKPEFKGKITEEDVRRFLLKFAEEGRIPKYGVPDKIIFAEAIPKTSVGKINKIELRKIYS